MYPLATLTLFILSMVLANCIFRNPVLVEKEILDRILSPNNYDPSIRPYALNDSRPLIVLVNMYIRSINDLDEMNMEYSTQLTFRQEWMDPRLQYKEDGPNFITLTGSERIWRPDIFFSNEKSGHFHNIIVPNDLIRIYPDGRVLYSTRISMKLSCPMDLRNFPLDNQICSIIIASYAYTTSDIVLKWKSRDSEPDKALRKLHHINDPKDGKHADVPLLRKSGEPVQISKNLHTEKFTLVAFFTDYCASKTNTGEYSCIKLDMLFSRQIHFYIIQTYMPTIFLVILTWLSFWLHHRSMTVRWVICILVLLSMALKASIVNANSPMTSYNKAIDVWTGICLTFIFAAFIELCIVNNSVMGEKQNPSQNLLDADETKTPIQTMCLEDNEKRSKLDNFNFIALKWLNKFPTKAQRIDAIFRILFPLAFALFNLVYWVSYMK